MSGATVLIFDENEGDHGQISAYEDMGSLQAAFERNGVDASLEKIAAGNVAGVDALAWIDDDNNYAILMDDGSVLVLRDLSRKLAEELRGGNITIRRYGLKELENPVDTIENEFEDGIARLQIAFDLMLWLGHQDEDAVIRKLSESDEDDFESGLYRVEDLLSEAQETYSNDLRYIVMLYELEQDWSCRSISDYERVESLVWYGNSIEKTTKEWISDIQSAGNLSTLVSLLLDLEERGAYANVVLKKMTVKSDDLASLPVYYMPWFRQYSDPKRVADELASELRPGEIVVSASGRFTLVGKSLDSLRVIEQSIENGDYVWTEISPRDFVNGGFDV